MPAIFGILAVIWSTHTSEVYVRNLVDGLEMHAALRPWRDYILSAEGNQGKSAEPGGPAAPGATPFRWYDGAVTIGETSMFWMPDSDRS